MFGDSHDVIQRSETVYHVATTQRNLLFREKSEHPMEFRLIMYNKHFL